MERENYELSATWYVLVGSTQVLLKTLLGHGLLQIWADSSRCLSPALCNNVSMSHRKKSMQSICTDWDSETVGIYGRSHGVIAELKFQ